MYVNMILVKSEGGEDVISSPAGDADSIQRSRAYVASTCPVLAPFLTIFGKHRAKDHPTSIFRSVGSARDEILLMDLAICCY